MHWCTSCVLHLYEKSCWENLKGISPKIKEVGGLKGCRSIKVKGQMKRGFMYQETNSGIGHSRTNPRTWFQGGCLHVNDTAMLLTDAKPNIYSCSYAWFSVTFDCRWFLNLIILTFAHSWIQSKQNTWLQLLGVPRSWSLRDIRHTGHWSVLPEDISSPDSSIITSSTALSSPSFSSSAGQGENFDRIHQEIE